MTTEKRLEEMPTNPSLAKTKALSQDELDVLRWEDEGGALGPQDGTGEEDE